MTKEEIIKICDNIIGKIQDLESDITESLNDVKELIKYSEELPTEISDIEDDEDDSKPED